ncbi:MAG: hypothetical protein Kow00121_50840 [Elainellaceae cyanobacterium]
MLSRETNSTASGYGMSKQTPLSWDKQALADWLKAEKESKAMTYKELETALGLHYGTLDWWRLKLVDELSPRSIEAIARYRKWSSTQVKAWLKIKGS